MHERLTTCVLRDARDSRSYAARHQEALWLCQDPLSRAMCQPDQLSDAEKQRRLGELQRRLTGQRLPEDFTNGAQDAVLFRYLAARGFDVDKALAVRPHPHVASKVVSTRRGSYVRGWVAVAGLPHRRFLRCLRRRSERCFQRPSAYGQPYREWGPRAGSLGQGRAAWSAVLRGLVPHGRSAAQPRSVTRSDRCLHRHRPAPSPPSPTACDTRARDV